MARSIIVDVRKAVVAGLKARVGLSGVQVTYAYPWGDVVERERIFTNRPRGTHEPAALKSGRLFRDESMEFDVVIQIEGVGKSSDETDDRAITLGQEVEEYFADNKTLAVAGLNWIRIVRQDGPIGAGSDKGSLSEITYTVAYRARLT